MVIDFRKNKAAPMPVEIKRVAVERVETCKHLGTVLDNDLKLEGKYRYHLEESPHPPLLHA